MTRTSPTIALLGAVFTMLLGAGRVSPQDWSQEGVVGPSDTNSAPALHMDHSGVPWIVLAEDEHLEWTRWEGDHWRLYERVDPYSGDRADTPQFAFDDNEVLWLVWTQQQDGIWSIESVRGYNGGWFGARNVAYPDPVFTYWGPQIAAGGGQVWVCYLAAGGLAPFDLSVARWANGGWDRSYGGPVTDRASNCDIAVDATGVPHLIWVNSHLYYATLSTDGHWTAPFQVDDGSFYVNSARITIGPDGAVHVVWSTALGLGPNRVYYRGKDGSGWSAQLAVTGPAQSENFPVLRAGPGSTVWVAWSRSESGQNHVVASQLLDSIFTPPQTLDSGRYTGNGQPAMDLGLDGRPWVVWNGLRDLGSSRNAILFSRYTVTSTPVVLSDLIGTPLRDGTKLHWQAKPDVFSLFRIERSLEDGAFVEVGHVASGDQTGYSWQERGLSPGTYFYRIVGLAPDGDSVFLGPVSVNVGVPPTRLVLEARAVVRGAEPSELWLGTPAAGDVHIQLMDAQGRRLNHLEAGAVTAGWQSLTWSPRTADDRSLASGVYFLQATLGGASSTARVVVLR